ncbi:hypothetical protein [Mycobacterium colombiense]|uniref:hypothetical protein n=1 Tax=Mycobacterium colombiense TaxID=339268 RepID=UPI0009E4C375|nr:hypothetical protein [Mycobacterium colombiense]
MGPIIPWLSDEQREQFLREGLVEEIADDEEPTAPDDSDATATTVDNCIAALDRLNVASDAGRPSCQETLREAGFRFGNGIIAASVKRRKERTVDAVLTVPDSA